MLGYGDKPFGADQFYGPFNSWERTKSWFVGVKQDLGKNTEFDFGFRRHTDEFILLRDNPSVYENNHIDKSWQADLRRHDQVSKNSALFYGAEGIHESIISNNLGDHDRSRGSGVSRLRRSRAEAVFVFVSARGRKYSVRLTENSTLPRRRGCG